MTWGKKLLQNLVVLHWMLHNLFPEASMENSPWWGWEESLHLFPVSQVVVVPDEAHRCCIVRKLHNVVGCNLWDVVVSHQSEQQGAQDTAPWGACAEYEDTGGILTVF